MTVALRLAQQGHDVTLLESASATGGLASPESIGDVTWDRFYHVMLLSDSHLVALLDELGLGHRTHWRQARTGFYGDGRLHEMSSSLDFARFPLLSLAEKARLAAVFDALLQLPEHAPAVERLLADIAARIAAEDARKARETAATRVDFFTMVRGDD